jgi:hypothetical protein
VLAAFVVSQVAPTFHDTAALRQVTKRPVLGVVSMLQNPAHLRRKRRGMALFVSGIGGLLALYAGVIAFALMAWRAAAN